MFNLIKIESVLSASQKEALRNLKEVLEERQFDDDVSSIIVSATPLTGVARSEVFDNLYYYINREYIFPIDGTSEKSLAFFCRALGLRGSPDDYINLAFKAVERLPGEAVQLIDSAAGCEHIQFDEPKVFRVESRNLQVPKTLERSQIALKDFFLAGVMLLRVYGLPLVLSLQE